MGGVNTVAVASQMPDGDAVYCYNVIASDSGLRSRLGYLEWCTGLSGATDGDKLVPTLLPFAGTAKNGFNDRLFAATSSGLWDISASTATPALLLAFPDTSGDAGTGVSCVVPTPAGHFLFYTDEQNGLFIYSEATDTWTQPLLGVNQAWNSNTDYLVDDQVLNGGNIYIATAGGTSASSGGPTGTGSSISDGSVTWDYVGPQVPNTIGPSLADQQLGYAGDPASFVAIAVWKSRPFLVERDTSRAWYLDVNSIYGTATSFDFGSKMQHGGPLRNLYSWSYDAGNGMDSMLVGISGAGDVVIYAGTDPTSADTFGIKGSWFLGGVVSGRNIATDFGGDVLVLSLLGLKPLSELISGAPEGDAKQYATYKITNLFNLAATTFKDLPGWAVHIHPTDNALLVTVPTQAGQPTTQLAMAFGKKGWFPYRDLPIYSAAVWNGVLYFGTNDGRVCRNEGYVDNVKLADASSFAPVGWSVLTASQNLGNAQMKRIHMLRPTVLSQTNRPLVQAKAVYGFSTVEPALPAGASPGGTTGTWNASTWDVSVWSGDSSPSQRIQGATGIGRDVAIAIRGEAISRTTLVGVDVFFDVGGLL